MVRQIVKKMLSLLASRVFRKLRVRGAFTISVHDEPAVDLVTTWNARCGIAAYSAFLTTELKRSARIRIIRVSDAHVLSPYFFVLGFETGRSQKLVHVQFAYGTFSDLKLGRNKRAGAFAALPFYLGLAFGGSPVVTTFHEVMKTMTAGGKIGLNYIKFLNKVICDVSDLIIVHTLESKKLMEKTYGVSGSKVKVIPMGICENPLFLDKEECKEKLGLSGKKVITLPGFVSKNKGFDLIVALLPQLGKDVHLLIAGGTRTEEDAAYYEELNKLAQRYHCIDRITFFEDRKSVV